MRQHSPDLIDIVPLGEADRACLDAVRAALSAHGSLDRFGLTLLHDHFPLQDGELLVETCDPDSRTLTIAPGVVDTNNTDDRLIETNWSFSPEGDVIAGLVCKVGCFIDLKDNHKRTHQRVNG